MKKLIYLFLMFSCAFTSINAQRNCGSMDHMHQQMLEDPSLELRMQDIEKQTQKFINNPEKNDGIIVTIPVVVHVVWKTNAQNISEAQIMSQIDVLNDDFRRMNGDADNTWPQAADTEIEFCLATIDPDGNPTSGIQRRKTNKPSFSANDFMKFNNKGGINAWPADDYLNIWVCNLGSGLLGYAQFPGGNSATDGVVNDYAYFGTTGTATAPFDLGRTCTHEVGHWLNLRHIWGDGGCSVDDFVSDTPLSDNPNYGCATGHVSCSSTDMVENYMDYSDDACMNLFTTGQSDRMNALFDSGGARESLLFSPACGGGSEPTCSDNIMNGNETGVDCGGPDCDPCESEPTCSDNIMNGNETGVDCGGPDCDPCDNGGGGCDTPTGTFASNIKPKRATLNWSSVDGAISYNIQIDEAGQTNWNEFTASNTKKVVSGLSNGQSYDWRVQADCGGGELSEWSSICNFQAGNSGSGDCAARTHNLLSNFSLHPNPATEKIFVTNIDTKSISQVNVLNTNGKVLSKVFISDLESGVPVNNLDSGMYFLNVRYIDGRNEVKKFFVVR